MDLLSLLVPPPTKKKKKMLSLNIVKSPYEDHSKLRPLHIQTGLYSLKCYFSYDIVINNKTTLLIRALLSSLKGGLNIGILL